MSVFCPDPTVDDLKKKNADFSAFLNSSITNLGTRADPVRAKFKSDVAAIYTASKWDMNIFGAEEFEEFHQASSVNYDQVTKLITKYTSDMIGGTALPGAGTDDPTTASAAQTAAKELDQALILQTAINLVLDVTSLLNVTVTGGFTSDIVSRRLAPGLMLHMYSVRDYVQDQRFLQNDWLVERISGYQLIYSAKQEAVEGKQMVLNTLLTNLASSDNALIADQAAYSKALEEAPNSKDPDATLTHLKVLNEFLKLAKSNNDTYKAQIKAALTDAAA